jgi:nitrate reductase NapE component
VWACLSSSDQGRVSSSCLLSRGCSPGAGGWVPLDWRGADGTEKERKRNESEEDEGAARGRSHTGAPPLGEEEQRGEWLALLHCLLCLGVSISAVVLATFCFIVWLLWCSKNFSLQT